MKHWGGGRPKFDFFFLRGATAPSGPESPCYPILKITLDMSQFVGLLWMSDRPEAETSADSTQRSQETLLPPVTFEPTVTASELTADLRLRPFSHWSRLVGIRNF